MTCADDDMESLNSLEDPFDDAVANIEEALEVIQEQLYTLTGITTAGRCGNCVFPFISAGWESDRCTTINGDSRPWCGTSGDDWEYCSDPSCPGLEGNSEEMSVHPMNTLGNCCKLFRFLSSNINVPNFFLDCGIPNRADDTDNRIVGGVKTEVGEYPWQVLLY